MADSCQPFRTRLHLARSRACALPTVCVGQLSRAGEREVRWMGCSPSRSNVWSLLPQRLRVELSRRCLLAMPPSEMHLGHFA